MDPPLAPWSERPRSALFQRPNSTRPIFPPFAPPLVTIVSPKSPPMAAHLSHASSVPHLSSPKPTPSSGLGSRPAPPIPPHFTRSINQLPVQNPVPIGLQEKEAPVNSPRPARKLNVASNINTALANAPPPVNRADKFKPSDNKNLLTLEARATTGDERVSPFSTPPSSDESPNQAFQAQGSRISPPRATISPIGRDISQFSPPTATSQKDRGTSPFSPPAAQDVLRATNRTTGVLIPSQPTVKFGDPFSRTNIESVEARPGLPPRRMTEKGPQPRTMRSNEARIVSTSRVARQVSQPVPGYPVAPSPISRIVPPPSSEFVPHPKRTGTNDNVDSLRATGKGYSPSPNPASYSQDTSRLVEARSDLAPNIVNISEYPDASQTNRRPPGIKQGIQAINTNYETRLFDFCGDYLCTTGYLTRAWDLSNGSAIMNLGHGEQTKVTALAFKPGAIAEEEGLRLWMGTNFGDLYEVDIPTQCVISTRSSAHSRREIVKIYRHQNSMWSLDDGGNLHVWSPDKSGLPSVQSSPVVHRIPKGHTFSIVIHNRLWLATGKDIRVFCPGSSSDADFQVTLHPLTQPNVGEVTSGTVISSQHDRVYFGHDDGKVSVYSTDFSCLGIFNVSLYKINALVGAGDYLWAGYSTGMIYVYDTRTLPWRTKKDWHAHGNPVTNILIDRSSVWKSGVLQVASIGTDNAVRIWDGMLEEDWLG